MQNQNNLSKQEQFKQINILFLALLAGQVLMFTILWFVAGKQVQGDPTFGLVIPLVMAPMIGFSFLIYNKRKEAGAQLNSVNEKLEHYRASKILQWAIVEGANLMGVIIYFFVESDFKILLALAFGLLVFILYRPSVQGFTNDYYLNPKESNF